MDHNIGMPEVCFAQHAAFVLYTYYSTFFRDGGDSYSVVQFIVIIIYIYTIGRILC